MCKYDYNEDHKATLKLQEGRGHVTSDVASESSVDPMSLANSSEPYAEVFVRFFQ
jgi:hypothetical protein